MRMPDYFTFAKVRGDAAARNLIINRIPIVLTASLLLCSLIYNFNGTLWDTAIHLYYNLFCLTGFVIVLSLWPFRLHLNYLDLSIVLLLVFVVLNRSLRAHTVLEVHTLMSAALLFYYLMLKKIQWNQHILRLYYTLVTGIGTELSVYGFLERFGVVESDSMHWIVTGNFANPGPFGGFLAVVTPFAFLLAINRYKEKNITHATVYMLAVAVLLSGIVLSESRTALVAAVVAMAYCLHFHFRFKKQTYYYILSFAALVFATFGFIKTFHSVSGRLLIWKISAAIFADHPLVGIGHEFFGATYLKYQASYFARGNGSVNEVLLAGNTSEAFNEVIKFAVENGVIGVGIIMLIIGFAFKSFRAIQDRSVKISSVAVLIAFFLFAQFSYPLYFLCFKLLLVNQVSILSGSTPAPSIGLRKVVTVIVLLVTAAGAWGGWALLRSTYDWREAYRLQYSDSQQAAQLFANASRLLTTDGYFFYNYGIFLQETDTKQSTHLLEQSEARLGRTWIYDNLAINYETLNRIDEAERMYLRAHHCIPVLLKPQVRLVDFYLRIGDKEKAKQWIDKILAAPVKVRNSETQKLLNELRNKWKE